MRGPPFTNSSLLLVLHALVFVGLGTRTPARGADGALPAGARLAIVGDSITEQKLYSKYMECYVLACSGVPQVSVFQFGWSGERADGFAARLENDLAGFRPTVATLCYGMNDGSYQPYRDTIGATYDRNMRSVVEKLEAFGVKTIVVGSPGAVDTRFFGARAAFGDQNSADGYNHNLGKLRDIDRTIAVDHRQLFADVHQTMLDAMKKAKTTLGDTYDVCGKDGFHPGPNGQLLMAYAFLKSLGMNGAIGEIQLDGGTATVTDGHKLVGQSAGKIEIESTRWPFCFDADPKSSDSTRSIVPFVPFNEDLNRLVLKVKKLGGERAQVTWGDESKEFTRQQLETGVNLAAEFSKTPFDESFRKFMGAVANKQSFETYMIKSMITQWRMLPAELKSDAELQAALTLVRQRLMVRQQQLDAEAKALLKPVKHTVAVNVLQ